MWLPIRSTCNEIRGREACYLAGAGAAACCHLASNCRRHASKQLPSSRILVVVLCHEGVRGGEGRGCVCRLGEAKSRGERDKRRSDETQRHQDARSLASHPLGQDVPELLRQGEEDVVDALRVQGVGAACVSACLWLCGTRTRLRACAHTRVQARSCRARARMPHASACEDGNRGVAQPSAAQPSAAHAPPCPRGAPWSSAGGVGSGGPCLAFLQSTPPAFRQLRARSRGPGPPLPCHREGLPLFPRPHRPAGRAWTLRSSVVTSTQRHAIT
jgi:hypothetical protein